MPNAIVIIAIDLAMYCMNCTPNRIYFTQLSPILFSIAQKSYQHVLGSIYLFTGGASYSGRANSLEETCNWA
jgi:hypothetical protein